MSEEKTPKVEKKEVSPQATSLDLRMKRVEIIGKIESIRSGKDIDNLTIKRMELENEELRRRGSGWNSPISLLIQSASAWCIDNERTVVGSEPAIRSLWDSDELAEIRHLILQKLRKL